MWLWFNMIQYVIICNNHNAFHSVLDIVFYHISWYSVDITFQNWQQLRLKTRRTFEIELLHAATFTRERSSAESRRAVQRWIASVLLNHLTCKSWNRHKGSHSITCHSAVTLASQRSAVHYKDRSKSCIPSIIPQVEEVQYKPRETISVLALILNF